MLDRILFNPDNRLLGASTSDLSHYGGQSDPSFAIRELRGDTPGDIRPDGASASSQTPAEGVASTPFIGDAAEGGTTALPLDSGAGSAPAFQLASPSYGLPSVTPVQPEGFTPSVTTIAPLVPTSFLPGAGIPATSQPSSGETPAGLEHVTAQQDLLHGSDGMGQGLDQLADGAGAVTNGVVAPVMEGVGDVLAPAAAAVDDVVGAVAGLVAPVTETVGNVAEGVTDTVTPLISNTVDTVADTASDLVDPVVDTLAGVTDAAAPALTPVVESVSPLVETLGNATTTLADTALDTVSATVGGVTDTLEGLTGTDPAGGVATLVSLVSVSDMFDLHPVDAPEQPDASGDPGFAMLDTLAAGDDHMSDPFLGGHHDSGGGDHASDIDHPFGM